ncbi:hypothetical protein Fmac_004785 [Flemingia macrophylla]|uniref:Uncharacterized protein n=1 Tax=Flemingia macrophylla TaxID=520843 RepID=A0ABD1N5X4_9FABA
MKLRSSSYILLRRHNCAAWQQPKENVLESEDQVRVRVSAECVVPLESSSCCGTDRINGFWPPMLKSPIRLGFQSWTMLCDLRGIGCEILSQKGKEGRGVARC